MGSDIFSWKCEAHNLIVAQHRSCPVCVSAKRSQLHAANLAHMPRYLFEQTLDVRAAVKVQEVPPRVPVSTDITYIYNRRCHEYQGYYALNSATQNMLQALETTKVKAAWARRLELQNRLTDPALWSACRTMASDLWYVAEDISEIKINEGVREQFITFLTKIIGEGQVIVPDTLQVASTKQSGYELNFKSHTKDLSHLNVSTCSLIRKLDAYEGGLGSVRMVYQGHIPADKHLSTYQSAVKAMALALWDAQPMDNSVRNFTKIKDQYLATVEWLYSDCGQRLKRVEYADPPAVPLTSLVAKLYAYLLADTKELHLRHSILELKLDKKNLSDYTRRSLEAYFVTIAALTCTGYASACLSDWQRVNATTQKELRELLADKYTAGVRR